MKVLNIIMSLDPITGGGTTERTFQISKCLIRNGIKCSILTTDVGITKHRVNELKGVQVYILKTFFIKRYFLPLFSIKKLKSIIKDHDVIHFTNHWTIINAIVFLFARQLLKKTIICPAGALRVFGRSKIKKRMYNILFGKYMIRKADAFIAISTSEFDVFYSLGIKKERIHLIPNGVAVEEFGASIIPSFRQSQRIGNVPFILFMGRLDYIKGPDILLSAYNNIQEKEIQHHLVFAGPDSGMLNRLKKMATEYGLKDKVHFVGFLTDSLKKSAYFESEILVIPSRKEAMSIVALEAGICHTPVLLTDQCGFSLVSEIGGGLVVPATVEGITIGLLKILDNKVDLIEMGNNLYSVVVANYSWLKITEQHIKLYNSFIDK